MSYFKGIDLDSSERCVFIYSGAPLPELEKAIDGAMTSIGYKHLGKGLYEKGSRTMRLLLGAMHKYFKFQVAVDASDPQNIKVSVSKQTSGMSGGLIGVNQVKNELVYLKRVFQAI